MKYSVGATYEGKNFGYLRELLEVVSHIEVSPDSIAVKQNGRIMIDPESLEHLKWSERNTRTPLVLHGVGLSIGSYEGWSDHYIDLLDTLFDSLTISWHSEHLAYTKVNGENIGTMLTLPRTDEALDIICERVNILQDRYRVPFLLENVISMLPPYEPRYSDAAFLNEITHRTGCGLILDIYNLECDAENFGLDINSFLNELDTDSVRELHVAGGLTDPGSGFQMDIHSEMIADSTIALMQKFLRKHPANLRGITFELLEEFIEQHGTARIKKEITRLNQLINAHEPAAASI